MKYNHVEVVVSLFKYGNSLFRLVHIFLRFDYGVSPGLYGGKSFSMKLFLCICYIFIVMFDVTAFLTQDFRRLDMTMRCGC